MPEAEVVRMKVRHKKPAVPPAAVETAKAKASTKKAAAKAEAKAPAVKRFAGSTTGLGVRDFQNQTLAQNFKKKFTDEQLAALWRKEFPAAVAYTVEHVAGVRNAWNKGGHGNEAPAKPLHGYAEDGTELPLWGDKSKAAKEKKAATAAAAAAEATAAKAVKKTKKVKVN